MDFWKFEQALGGWTIEDEFVINLTGGRRDEDCFHFTLFTEKRACGLGACNWGMRACTIVHSLNEIVES